MWSNTPDDALVTDYVEIHKDLLLSFEGATEHLSQQNLMAYLHQQGCPVLISEEGDYIHDPIYESGHWFDQDSEILVLMWRAKQAEGEQNDS